MSSFFNLLMLLAVGTIVIGCSFFRPPHDEKIRKERIENISSKHGELVLPNFILNGNIDNKKQ